jgi:hypothetical protein
MMTIRKNKMIIISYHVLITLLSLLDNNVFNAKNYLIYKLKSVRNVKERIIMTQKPMYVKCNKKQLLTWMLASLP